MRKAFASVIALFVFAALPARADTVSVQWFTVSNTAPDFSGGFCCSVLSNEVQGTLLGGLPVSNDPSLTFVNGSNQLQWWTPGSYVTATGSSVLTVPISHDMFITNGTGNNDASGFQTAILKGTLVVPTNAVISFGGDDDVFLALNNNVVDQVGGVHPQSDTTYDVTAGTYALTLFYADRQQVAANLQFSISGGSISAVPEPSTWAMMILGFFGVGFMAYRRKQNGPQLRLA